MSWTDDRVELLRKLWAEGLSASQIAAELGGVTRNAVIGKVHRLGLSGRAKSTSQSSAARQKRASSRSSGYNRSGRSSRSNLPATSGSRAGDADKASALVDIPEPTHLKLSLLKLTEQTCKWPVGDPQEEDFSFCGNNVREGAPYCEYHCRVAYQPVADRKRDRRPGNRETARA